MFDTQDFWDGFWLAYRAAMISGLTAWGLTKISKLYRIIGG